MTGDSLTIRSSGSGGWLAGRLLSSAISPNGDYLAALSWNDFTGFLTVFDLKTGKVIQQVGTGIGSDKFLGDGTVADGDDAAATRALLDCPVHAITEIGEPKPSITHRELRDDEDPAAHLKTEANEAERGFTR